MSSESGYKSWPCSMSTSYLITCLNDVISWVGVLGHQLQNPQIIDVLSPSGYELDGDDYPSGVEIVSWACQSTRLKLLVGGAGSIVYMSVPCESCHHNAKW